MNLTSVYQHALQLFFPARCAGCDGPCDEGASFCRTCEISLVPLAACCRRCALPLPVAVTRCLACARRPPAHSATWSAFEFGGAVASAIRRIKWSGRPDLARPLTRLFPESRLRAALDGRDAILPVPLHPRRLREREFNQAAVLALALRPRLPIDVGALSRIRDTAPQALLPLTQRRANVRDAFRASPRRVAGRRLLVVDDVMTSGATVQACSEALYEAGAADVAVLTVARAVP
jgi:ComF family protein